MIFKHVSKEEQWLFFLILLIGILLRLWTTVWEPGITYPDSTQYLHLAAEMKAGTYFQTDYDLDKGFLLSRRLAPLYSLIVAGVSCLLPFSLEHIGILVSLFMSSVIFLPVCILARHIHSARAGIVALSILSFQPYVLRWASPVLTEATFGLLFVSAIVLGLMITEKKDCRLNMLFGVIAGLAFMTKETGLSLILFQMVWLTVYYRVIDKLSWRKTVVLIGVMSVSFLMVCTPYFINVKNRTGNWALSSRRASVHSIAEDFSNFGGESADRDRILVQPRNEETRIDGPGPGEGAGNIVSLLIKKMFVNSSAYGVELVKSVGWAASLMAFIAVLAGLYTAWRKRLWRILLKEIYLLAAIGQFVILHGLITPYMLDGRYLYPVAYLVILFAGIGVVRVFDLWNATHLPVRQIADKFCYILAGLFVFAILLTNFSELQKLRQRKTFPYSTWAGGHKEVALELLDRGLVKPGTAVVSRKPYFAYYLQGKYLYLPQTFDQLLKKIADGEGDILIADSAVISRKRQLLVDLIWGNYPPLSENIIFSKRLPKYKRIITVYDLRAKTPPVEIPESGIEGALSHAVEAFKNGYLLESVGISRKVLEKDPNNLLANRIMAGAYGQYFLTTGIPNMLPQTVAYYQKYLSVNPNDHKARQVYEYLSRVSHD